MTGYEQALIRHITTSPPTPAQNLILRALVEHDGRISYEDLASYVYSNPDTAPQNELSVLKVHVCLLRQKLRPPVRIKAIWGEGYVLLGVAGIEPREQMPVCKRPSRSERTILRSLLDGRLHSQWALYCDLYEWRGDHATQGEIIKVFISKLRKKLLPGWEIQNTRGRGWTLVKVEPCNST